MYSGSVAFDTEDAYFLIDNADDGIDLFSLPDAAFIRHFPVDARSVRYGMQVAFGEQGAVIVSGSDSGRVHVFRLSDGLKICTLRHNARSIVQCVTVRAIFHRLALGYIPTDDGEP